MKEPIQVLEAYCPPIPARLGSRRSFIPTAQVYLFDKKRTRNQDLVSSPHNSEGYMV